MADLIDDAREAINWIPHWNGNQPLEKGCPGEVLQRCVVEIERLERELAAARRISPEQLLGLWERQVVAELEREIAECEQILAGYVVGGTTLADRLRTALDGLQSRLKAAESAGESVSKQQGDEK